MSRRAALLRRRRASGRCGLFGHPLRFLFLLELALHGPSSTAAIASAIGTFLSHAFTLANHLEACGVVTKDRRIGDRWFVDLDESFIGHAELRQLLLRLAPICGAGLKRGARTRSVGSSRPPAIRGGGGADKLFGSIGRTRTLLTLAELGETDQSRLTTLVGLNEQSLRNIVDHWESEGVVRCRARGSLKLISLSPDFPAAEELRALLTHIATPSTEYGAVASIERQRLEKKAIKGVLSPQHADGASLVCIGRRPQAGLLLALARHGPVRSMDLAAYLGVSENAVRSTGGSLVRLGLVARRTAPGTTVDLWFALDPNHRLSEEVRAYLLAIASIEPPRHINRKSDPPAGFPAKREHADPDGELLRLCGYDMRIRTLAYVYQRPGCGEHEITPTLRTRLTRVRRHLNALANRGHISYRAEAGAMRAALNPGFVAFHELQRLLSRMVVAIPSYRIAAGPDCPSLIHLRQGVDNSLRPQSDK